MASLGSTEQSIIAIESGLEHAFRSTRCRLAPTAHLAANDEPERASWTMARTAGRKHREVFYSQQGVLRADEAWHPSASSLDPTTAGVPPLDYLFNHLIKTKLNAINVLWQFASIVKPYIAAHGDAMATHINRNSSSSNARPASITSLLSCLQFSSDADSGFTHASGAYEPLLHCGQPPSKYRTTMQGTLSSSELAMRELTLEAAALGYRTCVGGGKGEASSPSSFLSSSSSPASSCAVGRASELLFWALRGEDYAVGRGRAVQSSVLLDALQEEVGGEEAPYWVGVPAAVSVGGGGADGGGVSRYAPSRRRPHPQFVAYRGVSYEGFEMLVHEIDSGHRPLPISEEVRMTSYLVFHPVAAFAKQNFPLPSQKQLTFSFHSPIRFHLYQFSARLCAER